MIIEKIWRGDIAPGEAPRKNHRKINRLYDLWKERTKELYEHLDREGQELLHKLEDTQHELIINESENAFIQGFSLGIRLSAETMLNE